MTLRPCASCRRHIRGTACPFCGVVGPEPVTRRHIAGRFSRAAVFAGATLAGCTAPPPVQHAAPPPPDPIDQQRVIEHREADPPPPDDRHFAKPPGLGHAEITGRVTNRDGGPLPEVTVTLEGMNVARAETTDADGRYSVRELAPGPYTLIFRVETNDRHGRPAPVVKQVTVADGVTETVNVVLVLYQPVDRGPCCKPYGAPPARRRVV